MADSGFIPLKEMQKNSDHGMRLSLVRPGETRPYGSAKHIFDFTATWNRTEASRIRFKTFKDAPGAAELQSDIEVIVELWEPWTRRWIQPVNSRFIIEGWKEDLVDETNLIEYSGIQSVTMLDKAVVHRRPQDDRLNAALDRAEEAFRDAESEYKSAWSSFRRGAVTIRQRHGMWNGRQFAQAGFAAPSKSRKIPNGSIGVFGWRANNRWTGNLYYFSNGKWKRLSRTKWTEDKQELVRDGLNVIRKRRVVVIRKEQLRKATIAARETSERGRRYFYNRSSGHILQMLFREAQARDANRGFSGNAGSTRLKGVMRSFSNAKDSRGVNWGGWSTESAELQVGQGLFSVIQDLQERGLCDWQTRNGTLDLVPNGALRVNQSSRVSIRLGQDLSEGVTNGYRTEHASAVLIVGDGGRTFEYSSQNGTWTPWGYWEGSIGESSAEYRSHAGRLTSEKRAEMVRRFKLEPSRKMTIGHNSALPMVDYQPHHLISVYESSGNRASRVVDQILLNQADATSPLETVVTFETRFQSTPARFERSLSKTMGGINFMQGRIPIDQSVKVSPELEAELRFSNIAPPIEGISGVVKFNAEGQPRVALKVSWASGYESEFPPIPESQYEELIEENETDPIDDGFEEEEEV